MRWDNIVFDFDGVIAVNTQAVAFRVLADALAGYGVELSTDQMFERYLGWRGEQILDDVQKVHAVTVDKGILEPVRETIHSRLLREVRKDPTLDALLQVAGGKFICSVNKRRFIENLLRTLKIDGYFPAQTIFGEQADCRFKPHPDIYLACLAAHKLDAARTCAVEDSVAGVHSARGAGL
ncbi:HAD family phosphatase, partial [Mycobacterium simiae]